MTPPRVIGEMKRHVPEMEPPSEIRPHEWLSRDSCRRFEDKAADANAFDIYLTSLAESKIREQATEAAPSRLEVMGLLLGEVRSWQNEMYTVIRDVGTTDLKNTAANVKFDRDALPKLFAEMDAARFDYIIVGWYHSHPGHTCFMSKTDLSTQRAMFTQPYHCAFVIDPVNRELEAFKLLGEGCVVVPFAVVDCSMPRTRRLKYKAGWEPPRTGI